MKGLYFNHGNKVMQISSEPQVCGDDDWQVLAMDAIEDKKSGGKFVSSYSIAFIEFTYESYQDAYLSLK